MCTIVTVIQMSKRHHGKWTEIKIRFEDGFDITIYRRTIEEFENLREAIKALEDAKLLSERLAGILK